MILFDETENKYYELVTYLLRGKKGYTLREIQQLLNLYLPGERDFEVTEALFGADKGEEIIFVQEEKIIPVMDAAFPVRNSVIEKQAAKTLAEMPYTYHFLKQETIQKLKKETEDIEECWNPADITIKNKFACGVSDTDRIFEKEISLIAQAIRNQKAILYDNIRPGRVKKSKAKAFPVKIEFSIVNDRFRISAYEPYEHRFIKINLDTMRNIEELDEKAGIDLAVEYADFIQFNTKKVLLDVEPVNHVVERCFRVFSYFDRKARYDKEENKYRLEVSYHKADENEILRNILSLGSYVVVLEPKSIQKEIYRRISAASRMYD